jgi:hypothetical protein
MMMGENDIALEQALENPKEVRRVHLGKEDPRSLHTVVRNELSLLGQGRGVGEIEEFLEDAYKSF